MFYLKVYMVAVVLFFMIDMTWLGLVARNFYKAQIGTLLKAQVNWSAAFAFYALFLVGLMVFVILPAIEAKSWTRALSYGAFFGVITYATYDLTNLATLKDWPLTVSIVDIIWGGVLSASISVLTYLIVTKWLM